MDAARLDLTLIAQARTVIARIEMVSHGRTVNLGPSGGNGEPLYPPGGISSKDDREPDQPHKSHLHYEARLRGCKTDRDLEQVIEDATATLSRWQHSPAPPRDSVAWKAQVAADTRKPGVIAKQYGITRQYVWQIKKMYGQQAA